MPTSLAVYAGSFDPPTNGHLWMIRQAARLFDSLVVAIGTNADKRYAYSIDDRLRWLTAMTSDLGNVRIEHFQNQFLVRFAASVGASFIVRGVRNEADFAFERTMRHINADLHPELATVFLIPPRDLAEVSSSLVKGLIGPAGWRDVAAKYLPEAVFRDLAVRHA